MNKDEIALQLTLKAIEANKIAFKAHDSGKTEEVNNFNAEQIIQFFNKTTKELLTDYELKRS